MSGVSAGEVARPLVGRVAEMRELTRALAAARKGRASAIAVTGEPGIGKTRLLQEIRTEALAQGFQVLEGRGTELEREFPYAVVIDAFDEPLGSLSRTSLKALGEECLSELSRILPSLHRWGRAPARSTRIDRHRCHRSVRVALERLAARRPLLLILDDVHWVDHASLEVIAHLLRNPVPRCALMLAHRSRQLPTAHTNALARAVYDNTMSSVELGPLSIAEAAELLSDRVDTADLSDFYRECGGNPFYLQEVSRARIRLDGLLGGHRTSTGDSYHIPTIVHDVLEQEIQALSMHARNLLQAAAVAGEPFDLELASDIAELVETEIWQTVDELVASGLICETETPGRLTFRHPLIRRAVYERSGYGWRRNAHKRAAKALANRSTTLSIRAHHLEHCGEPGDEEAIAVLVDAGTAASQGAPVAAARWFRAALRLLPNEESADRRLALSMSLAEVLNACGRLRESREVLNRTLALTAPAEPGERARLMAMLAVIEQGLGNAVEGRRLLTTALTLVRPDGVAAAALELELAKTHLALRDWAQAVAVSAKVRRSARAQGDRRMDFLGTAASAFLKTTQLGDTLWEAGRDLDEAVRTLDTLTDAEIPLALIDGLVDVVISAISLERFAMTVEYTTRGIRLCRSTGHGRRLVDFLHLQGLALLMQGQLERGLAVADEAVEVALMLDNPPMVAMAESTRCWILSLLGHTDQAFTAGAGAVRITEQLPRGRYSYYPPLIYGMALIQAGRYRRGRRLILGAGGQFEIYPSLIPQFHPYLVEAELALGRIDAAEHATRRIEIIADASPFLPMRIGHTRSTRARVLLARGEIRAAADHAEQAVAEYQRSGCSLEVARARLLLGHALAELGAKPAARREFDSALMIFDSRNAARLAEQARLALRRVGERHTSGHRSRSRATHIGFGDLTERQTEIVNRIVLGRTNRQISEDLYVSEKTIEAHLSRLFAKLGVSSRTELAALVAAQQDHHRTRPARDRNSASRAAE
ncbi:hypothetical protein IFM12275_07830 [Nocardia sputorum]|uniref:helix-turn-helix transcriptional regulator n=1 Tax=Nocardia sputorum TaxID=2984338 RepID=UPI0024906762|nr:BREX system ATP-binding domain-containing protein [Nocardia sputorum]BDT90807.1 hypothetical protein IFM12275_07830 [Nocardia sputorum]